MKAFINPQQKKWSQIYLLVIKVLLTKEKKKISATTPVFFLPIHIFLYKKMRYELITCMIFSNPLELTYLGWFERFSWARESCRVFAKNWSTITRFQSQLALIKKNRSWRYFLGSNCSFQIFLATQKREYCSFYINSFNILTPFLRWKMSQVLIRINVKINNL